jgi:hypothetical protein
MSLVTLDEAKASIRYPGLAEEDSDLTLRLLAAEAVVLDYVNQRHGETSPDWAATVAAWTAETAPPQVKAAVLYMFGDLSRFRGDDEPPPDGGSSLLPGRVRMWLDFFRDPTVA